MSGIVSGFRGCGLRRSPGSAVLHRAAFPFRKIGTVARAEFLPPYSRAAATVLHRLPGTESAVNVAERCAFRLGRDIALLRVNGSTATLGCAPWLHAAKTAQPRVAVLRNVLAAASAQIHARPSGGTEFHIQRCVKHLLQ